MQRMSADGLHVPTMRHDQPQPERRDAPVLRPVQGVRGRAAAKGAGARGAAASARRKASAAARHELSAAGARGVLEAVVRGTGVAHFTVRQFCVAWFLADEPHEMCTVRGIARYLGVSRAVVTRVFDRLEREGFAVREPDPRDRRSLVCSLTAAGWDFAERFLPRGSPVRQELGVLVRTSQDLSVRQLCVVLFLKDEPPAACTVRGLSAHLQLPKPGVSRSIDRLETLRLATRRPDPHDRRSVLVQLTPAGRTLARLPTQPQAPS